MPRLLCRGSYAEVLMTKFHVENSFPRNVFKDSMPSILSQAFKPRLSCREIMLCLFSINRANLSCEKNQLVIAQNGDKTKLFYFLEYHSRKFLVTSCVIRDWSHVISSFRDSKWTSRQQWIILACCMHFMSKKGRSWWIYSVTIRNGKIRQYLFEYIWKYILYKHN